MVGSKDLTPDVDSTWIQRFWNNQFKAKAIWPSKETNLADKTAIITGSNVGLGYETARQLVQLNLGHLVMAVRSTDKGEKAAASLRLLNPKTQIDVWQLDMASYDSIEAFCSRASKELETIDMVLLNAGLANFNFRKAASTGPEEMTQVNYLSTIFMAHLLLPILKAKRRSEDVPTLAVVSAALSLAAKFEERKADQLWPAFDSQDQFNAQERYHTSKMLAHAWLWKLVESVSSEETIVNLVDCAFVKGTALHRNKPLPVKPLIWLFGAVAGRSMEEGASCFVDALISQGQKSHGCFLMNWQPHPFHPMLYSKEGEVVIEKVWQQTFAEYRSTGRTLPPPFAEV